jgi:DNA-binding transcriptional LysR family regulator
MISLRHIEVFHAVYQSGSISGAARMLRVSQPSVSKVLRHAEGLIGFALFTLVKGRLVPTEEAHQLFAEAHDVQVRVEAMKSVITNLRRGGDGHLRLAMLHALGLDLVPRVVAEFRHRHPHVTFDIRTAHSDQLVELLFERSCDIAISYDVPPRPRLTGVRLGSTELAVLFHRDDWPDAPPRIEPEMLRGRNLIRLVNPGAVGTLINSYLEASDVAPSDIVVHTYYVAAALVRQRAGIAVVDAFTARSSLTPALDYRPLAGGLRFDVFALHLEDHPPSKPAQDFLREVGRAVGALAL